jgi:hypothetical protein
MGARFAGSERLGDRRRRRLAVETDGLFEDAAGRRSLRAPLATSRLVENAHAGDSPADSALSFDRALGSVVPEQWWKYLLGGLACLAIATGLVIAGAHGPSLTAAVGPGIVRLFAFPKAPVARWFSSLLLVVSAQWALLIWWARSHSVKDFDGRYWLWIRVSGAWLLLSGCVATDAAEALTSTFQHLWPHLSDRTAALGWLMPAAAAGVATLVPLAREMRGCRWSRGFLMLGAAAYVAAAVLHLELESVLAVTADILSSELSLLAGQVAIFLSMWLHARHVLYCSIDPEIPPPSRWRIPRPHFRLPRLGRNRMPSAERQSAGSAPAYGQRPARSDKTGAPGGSALECPAETAPTIDQAAPVRKPNLRIDLTERHPESNSNAGRTDPAAHSAENRAATEVAGGSAVSPRPEKVALAPPSTVMSDSDAGSAAERDETASRPSDSDEMLLKPDLRGLSKKQRRRLMQELRERERAAGR